MMLRLVTKLAAYFSTVALVLACAGWGWGQEAAALADSPPPPESGLLKLVSPAAGVEQSPQTLFESLPRFGEGLFALPAAPQPEDGLEADRRPSLLDGSSAARPPANLPVPPNYLIGPGDTLALRVWSRGWEQVAQTGAVSPEGSIVLPELGQITAAGLTLAQLREALLEMYTHTYAEPTVTVVVAEQRVVEVYVTGDAVWPGKYTLPGMATVFAALYACGGPSPIGSYRRVHLNRRGEPSVTIDLYDYLLGGQREYDVVLMPGDVLFIPPAGEEVGLVGEVRRPARYELKGTTSVADAVEMAGGLKPTAYVPALYLWRAAQGRRWRLTSVDCSVPESPGLAQPLHDGDLLIVKRIRPRGDNTVELKGAIKRPGYYPVAPETRLSDLLREAEGVAFNAHLGTGVLLRQNADLHYEITTFSVQDILADKPEADLTLQPDDIVEIFTQEDVEPAFEVEINGAVLRPGKYVWAANMRLSHLLLIAGGPVPGAYLGRAELLRINPNQRYQAIAVNLQAALGRQIEADIMLERGDILQVKLQEEVEPVPQAYIEGYVRTGGAYPRREGMKISDLIFAAGGLQPGAGPTIELTHGHFEGRPQTVHLQLIGDPDSYRVVPDLLLADNDSVGVSGRGEFKTQADLVHLQGRVQRPGSYAIKTEAGGQGYTVWDLLTEGGGLLEDANPDGIVVYRRRDILMAETQEDDLNRVVQLLNQETQQPTLQIEGGEQARTMSRTVGRGLQSVLSNPSSVNIVLPPRPLSREDRVAAIPVYGSKLIASQGREENLELQAGDTVVVRRRVNTVTVLGAVPRPGTVPYVAGQTCAAYVNDSGGFRADAAAERLVVVHANGRVTPIRRGDVPQPGDVIVIPTKHIVRTVRTESTFQQWLRTVVSLATAALIF